MRQPASPPDGKQPPPVTGASAEKKMASREIDEVERYLLAKYQHLMRPHERMVARSLEAANFDLDGIPKQVWNRIWHEFPGVDRTNPWKLPINICVRLLNENRNEIEIPDELKKR
jgi:hypothetical protein